MKLILAAIALGILTVTSYRSVPEQTDGSPFVTATGERCNVHGIAVSQDLLAKNGGPLQYGDLLYVDGVGWRVVNDTMNARWRHRADVWVATREDEHKFGVRRLRVWIVKAVEQEIVK